MALLSNPYSSPRRMIFLRPSGAVFFFFIAVYLTLTNKRRWKRIIQITVFARVLRFFHRDSPHSKYRCGVNSRAQTQISHLLCIAYEVKSPVEAVGKVARTIRIYPVKYQRVFSVRKRHAPCASHDHNVSVSRRSRGNLILYRCSYIRSFSMNYYQSYRSTDEKSSA